MRQKKFLLILPLIVTPFLLLIFWLLGGGQGSGVVAAQPSAGLNMHLPDAKLAPISALDKLSFYTKAKQDSLKRLELEQLDPNFSPVIDEDVNVFEKRYEPVYRSPVVYTPPSIPASENLRELEQMVQSLQQPKKDPEMEALNQTLQQLIALNEPKLAVFNESSKTTVFTVKSAAQHRAGFYGESSMGFDTGAMYLFKAVIHGDQLVQHGAVVKLRLMEDVMIQQEKIPAGVFLFGLASLQNERLQIEVRSIPYKGQLFPVSLAVVDMDGIEGIHVPGSIEREVVKQAADQSVQSIGMLSPGQSISSQVAAAGIGTAKNILSRKARQVRVTVKSGYQLLLRDEKRREL
jgi:conjugative transposon TraM protein